MTRLNSFASQPKTYPQDYPIERLMTQYRSIPSIGAVFSQFAYGGVLKHHRQEKDQKPLVLGPDLSVSSLNIIKFPTSKYESIYRPKKLNQSNYQIYSALFTYEFSRFLAELGKMMNLPLRDSLVIGDNTYCSLFEKGLL